MGGTPTFFMGIKLEKVLEKVKKTAVPLIEESGADLVDLELKGGSTKVFRFYVDKAGGITIGECAAINKKISRAFENLDSDVKGPYRIEVSSPGLDRPFTSMKDYLRNRGRTIEVTYYGVDESKQRVKGGLEEVNESGIRIVVKKSSIEIPFDKIIKAKQAIKW